MFLVFSRTSYRLNSSLLLPLSSVFCVWYFWHLFSFLQIREEHAWFLLSLLYANSSGQDIFTLLYLANKHLSTFQASKISCFRSPADCQLTLSPPRTLPVEPWPHGERDSSWRLREESNKEWTGSRQEWTEVSDGLNFDSGHSLSNSLRCHMFHWSVARDKPTAPFLNVWSSPGEERSAASTPLLFFCFSSPSIMVISWRISITSALNHQKCFIACSKLHVKLINCSSVSISVPSSAAAPLWFHQILSKSN